MLETNARKYYNQIAESELTPRARKALLDVYVDFLEQRYPTKGILEIETMLLGVRPDLRETQSGKELIQIGREEGKMEGNLEATQKVLISLIKAKFGGISQADLERVLQLKSVEKLEELAIQMIQATNVDQLKW